MKAIKFGLIAAGVLLAATSGVFAQGRSFSSSPANVLSADYSGSGTLNNIDMHTNVTVNPYLYISGAFARDFTVDGWGSGTSSASDTIDVYHNETLTLTFSGFGDPTKATGTGDLSIPTTGQVQYSSANGGVLSGDTGTLPLSSFNALSPVSVAAADSAGHLQAIITRTLNVVPGNGPGTYTSGGVMTISRS